MAVKIENFRADSDLRWLGSMHGVHNARTVTINTDSFSSKARDGVIPSGTPVTIANHVATPYEAGNKFSGFLLTDTEAGVGKVGVAVLDHGRVLVSKLPETFTPPEAANDESGIIFVKES